MKTIKFLILFLLIFNIACFSQVRGKLSNSDSLLIEKIEKSNPKSYTGKSLNDFLSNTFLKRYTKWLPMHEPPGVLYAILLLLKKHLG